MRAEILLTGASGFVGGHLADRLVAAGVRPRILVRDPERLRPSLRDACELVHGDLGDSAALAAAVTGVTHVYHCAANVATWDSDARYRAANVDGVARLLAALAHNNPELQRLVHLSTVDVYGYPRKPCDEDCPLTGAGFGYGASKLAGELLLREVAAAHGIPYTVLRPGNVIGPRGQFVSRIGRELIDGLMLTVNGGRAHAGLIDVGNLVDAMLWAGQSPAAANRVFNVRDPHDASWADFIRDLRGLLGGRGRVIDLPFTLADIAAVALETPYRLLRIAREPMLHRLVVRIFGRTCGHSVGRIQAAGCPLGAVSYEQSLERAAGWFSRESMA